VADGRARTGEVVLHLIRRVRYHLNRLLLRGSLRIDRGTQVEQIGSGYGSWVVPVGVLDEGSVCYCAGVGEDTQLDEELLRRGHTVVGIDPTPRAIAHAGRVRARCPGYRLEPVGLWSARGVARFYGPRDPAHVSHSILNLQATESYFDAPVERVTELATRLGHDRVDLLKLDIEGAEHAVIADLAGSGPLPLVLLVEFDQPVPLRRVLATCRLLRRLGYRPVYQQRWNTTWVRSCPVVGERSATAIPTAEQRG
jgi:FkbM family methyltransferase